MRRVWVLGFAIALVGTAAVADAAEIGAVLAGNRHVFWKAMARGIQQAGKDLEVSVVVRSPVDDDVNAVKNNVQLQIIHDMIQDGTKGIVLAPMPVSGVPTPVPISVPTLFVDRGSQDFTAPATISTDNTAAGAVAARSLAGVLPKGAKVALLRLAKDVTSTTEREQGFLTVAREQGWEVVVDSYLGHGVRDAQSIAAKALAGYGGRIDAAFAPNESTTFGALLAIQDLPADRRPRLVGFDYRPEFEDALKTGTLHALIVQDAFHMGYQAVQRLLDVEQGRPVPAQIAVDVVTVTPANLADPAIQAAIGQYRE